jgi:hypothetical protein
MGMSVCHLMRSGKLAYILGPPVLKHMRDSCRFFFWRGGGFALFRTLLMKREFNILSYIALFTIHMKCDRAVQYKRYSFISYHLQHFFVLSTIPCIPLPRSLLPPFKQWMKLHLHPPAGAATCVSTWQGRAIAQAVSRWLPTATARVQTRVLVMWDFVVNKVALGQVFSEYFGYPCQSSFHQFLHNHHHLSSGAGTIGQ